MGENTPGSGFSNLKFPTPEEDKKRLQERLEAEILFNAGLERRVKKRDELFVFVEGSIIGVEYKIYSGGRITPQSERVLDGPSPSYPVGDQTEYELLLDSASPVKKLQGRGWLALEKGNEIRAHLYVGKKEQEKDVELTRKLLAQVEDDLGKVVERFRNDLIEKALPWGKKGPTPLRSYFVMRDLNETEEPLKIEKLRDGKVVATYILK